MTPLLSAIGKVKFARRDARQLSSDEWIRQLRNDYGDPQHWYKDAEGAPFTHFTGGYWHEPNGQMNVEVLEGTKPYETYSDDISGLAIRAAFLPNVHEWVIDDRQPEPVAE